MSFLSTSNAKFVDDAVSLSFSASNSQRNCHPECHPWKLGICYARRQEVFRPNIKNKYETHEEIGTRAVVDGALAEMKVAHRKGKTIRWFRISVNGGLPNKPKAKDIKAIAELIDSINSYRNSDGSIPKIHLPIETIEKSEIWKTGIAKYAKTKCENGQTAATVRASVDLKTFERDTHCLSTVVPSCKTQLQFAKELKHKRTTATGRQTQKCNMELWLKTTKSRGEKVKMTDAPRGVHCGDCTHCSDENIDVIFLQ